MHFNFCFANLYSPGFLPSQQLTIATVLGDAARFLRRAIEDAGHTLTFSVGEVRRDAVNLFWERFYYFGEGVDLPAQLRRDGYRFGLICTEPMTTEGAYNPFEFEPAASRELYDRFVHSAKLADFVWYLMEEAGPACRAINPNSHFLPFGHVPGYAELGDAAARRPTSDFVFHGVVTERRGQIIAALRERGYTVVAQNFQPDYVRLQQMETARVALSPQKSAAHTIFSLARVYHAIMNRVPIVVEYDGPANYLSPYCLIARPANFLDVCAAYARRADLARQADERHERFAREMPMRPAMERLLRDTFGV